MKTLKGILKTILPLVIAAVLLFIVTTAVGNLSGGSRAEEKEHLEEALRRAALSCYASEGYFPPDLDYIIENYSVQVDREHFHVFYDVFAENMMPSIDVVVRNEQRKSFKI